MRAALNGQIDKVRSLLEAGVDPNCRTKNGYTALMGAALEGHGAVVELLLQAGADPNIRYIDDRTALFGAVHQGHVEVVEILLQKGANPNVKEKTQNQTPLFFAVDQNHPGIIRLLINAGADLEAKEKVGQYTPLFFAVLRQNTEATKVLLEAGANPYALGNEGESVLDMAEDLRNPVISKLLSESIESSEYEQPKKLTDFKKLQRLVTENKVRLLIDEDLPYNVPISLFSFERLYSKGKMWLELTETRMNIKYPEPWEKILRHC